MKLKTISTIGLCVGLVGLVAIVAPYIISYFISANEIEGIGIIGAADGPTARFLIFKLFINEQFLPITIFLTLIVLSVIYLIFNETATKGCAVKTTALSVGISASIAATIFGFLNLHFLDVFNEASYTSTRFHISQAISLLFPIVFIILLIFFCLARKSKPSVGGTLLDIVTSILLVIPFTSFIVFIDNLLS